MIKFNDKKEEFIYYVKKAEFFKDKNSEEYLKCLKKAKELLKEIEKEE